MLSVPLNAQRRTKQKVCFSTPIRFLEGRRCEFHVPFVCVNGFHVELPVPCIFKVSWLSEDFTVFKQAKIYLKINNHNLGRPQDNKRSVFLQGDTHLGLWVLSSTSQIFIPIWLLKKSQTYLEKKTRNKTKKSGKNLLLLEIKFMDSACMVSQPRSHLCSLNCKMKIIWNTNMTILGLTTKWHRDALSYHGQHSAPPPNEKGNSNFGLGT